MKSWSAHDFDEKRLACPAEPESIIRATGVPAACYTADLPRLFTAIVSGTHCQERSSLALLELEAMSFSPRFLGLRVCPPSSFLGHSVMSVTRQGELRVASGCRRKSSVWTGHGYPQGSTGCTPHPACTLWLACLGTRRHGDRSICCAASRPGHSICCLSTVYRKHSACRQNSIRPCNSRALEDYMMIYV